MDLEEKVLEKFNYEIPNFLKIHFDLEKILMSLLLFINSLEK